MMASSTTYQPTASVLQQKAAPMPPNGNNNGQQQHHATEPRRDSWQSRPSSPDRDSQQQQQASSNSARRAMTSAGSGSHPMSDRAGGTSGQMTPNRIYATPHHISSSSSIPPHHHTNHNNNHNNNINNSTSNNNNSSDLSSSLKVQTSHSLYPHSTQTTPTAEGPPSPRSRSYQPIRPLSTPLPGEYSIQQQAHQPQQHLTPSQSQASSPTAASHFHHHHQQHQHQQGPPTGQHIYNPVQPFPPSAAGPHQPPQNLQQLHPQPIAPASHSINPRPGQQYHHHTAAIAQHNFADDPRRMNVGIGNQHLVMPSVVKEEYNDMNPDMQGMTGLYGMSAPSAFPRRKAVRAAQACDACRTRKAKCDEGRPHCTFCESQGIQCVYREVPIPKQDRTLMGIQTSLDRQEKTNTDKLAHIEKLLQDLTSKVFIRSDGPSAAGETSIKQEPAADPLSAPEHETWTMPRQHTTAAHKLLQWKAISPLVRTQFEADYVMKKESLRGPLNIYGWGELDISGDGREIPSPAPPRSIILGGNVMPNWSQAPLPGGGLGYGASLGLQLDSPHVEVLLRNYLDNIYVLHPFLDRGLLKRTMREFVREHGTQPIFPQEDEEDTEDDGDTYSGYSEHSVNPQYSFGSGSFSQPGTSNDYSQHASEARSQSFSNGPSNNVSRGNKRKRSSTSQQTSRLPPQARRQTQPDSRAYFQPSPPAPPQQEIPGTLSSCVLLLVLALGAISGHRSPVPGPIQRIASNRPMLQVNQYGQAYDLQGGQQVNDAPPQLPKNIDSIPGLAYFARATEILSHHSGQMSLPYVQANLLAGLYSGQIGRVMDSWKWISNACMACQVMVRTIPDSIPDPVNNSNLLRDFMLRAFWSCLQLESDVLAELDLPLSNITNLEEQLPYPTGLYSELDDEADPQNDLTFMYFTFQCSLRKLLNSVHHDIYRVAGSRTPGDALITAKSHSDGLQDWREALPVQLRWNDTDPPATDINAARLRAKYYGAKYIIHRPFLQVYIHTVSSVSNAIASPALSNSDISQSSPSSAASNPPSGSCGRRGSVNDDLVQISSQQADMEVACRTCLEAAVKSTSAFHGFDPDTNRPVLTNIFGTAHAQFGNLLVLQAAYHHSRLRSMVDREVLKSLVESTVHFLDTLSPISPALAQDAIILQDSARKLGFEVNTHLSFNSN